MAGHTKGPWEVGSSDGEYSLMVYCDDATGQRVADCTNNLTFHSFEEKQANARLIAAAPDLLAALEFYADPNNWIDSPSWDGDPDCFTPKAVPVTDEDGRPCDCGATARAAIARLLAPAQAEQA